MLGAMVRTCGHAAHVPGGRQGHPSAAGQPGAWAGPGSCWGAYAVNARACVRKERRMRLGGRAGLRPRQEPGPPLPTQQVREWRVHSRTRRTGNPPSAPPRRYRAGAGSTGCGITCRRRAQRAPHALLAARTLSSVCCTAAVALSSSLSHECPSARASCFSGGASAAAGGGGGGSLSPGGPDSGRGTALLLAHPMGRATCRRHSYEDVPSYTRGVAAGRNAAGKGRRGRVICAVRGGDRADDCGGDAHVCHRLCASHGLGVRRCASRRARSPRFTPRLPEPRPAAASGVPSAAARWCEGLPSSSCSSSR